MAFRWPLNNFTITQGFGGNADYYKRYGQAGHNGIDMGAGVGKPVYAADEGTVAFEGWGKSGDPGLAGWMGDAAGICILINHVGSYGGYAHLLRTVVNKGQKVSKGQLIGFVGATGAADGSHLHFEMLPLSPNFANGYAGRINPLPFIETTKTATAAQIKQAYRDILEREADPAGLAHYAAYTIDFVRRDLSSSAEKRRLDSKKAEASRVEAEQRAAEAARAAAEAKKATEAKAALEAAKKAEEERLKAEAEAARVAEEERAAQQAAEEKAQSQKEIELKANKEAAMATAQKQQTEVQRLADDVAASEVVKDLVAGVSKKTKMRVYIIGDTLIGLGLIVPNAAIVFGVTDMIRVVALSGLLATAGAFVLTMFGIYKSNAK